MIGGHKKAKEVIEGIADIPSSEKQSTLIDLAFCHESLKDTDSARTLAAEVLAINRNSFHGLQAQAIIIDLTKDDPKRDDKLKALEQKCRNRDASVVANNIALTRAREHRSDPDTVTKILMPVVRSKATKDFYNRTRAAIELAEIALRSGQRLTEAEQSYLIVAYHFIFNERLPGLFDRCHDALWKNFSATGDVNNLLALFRHSSLHWRLRDSDSIEKQYLNKLKDAVGNLVSQKLATLSKEAAYYLVRAVSYNLLKGPATSRKNASL
jgi:hypothetical protein